MKTSNVVVRVVTASDHADIIRIVEDIALQFPERKAQFNWGRSQIHDELFKSISWAATDHEGVKAFLCARETADFLEITVLATATPHRNQGLQSLLIQRIFTEAAKKKKNVLLEVHEDNLSAINFYRKCGFSELPVRKNYYRDGKNALVFIYRVLVT